MTDKAFVTSDNPTAVYNIYLERMGCIESGLACRGVLLYMPLSPKIAVILYDDKVYKIGSRKQSFVDITNCNDIKELNNLTAINSYKTILFNPTMTSPAELEWLGIQSDYFTPREMVVPMNDVGVDGVGIIIGTHRVGLSCKLHLSIVKYLPRYATMNQKDFNCQSDRYRESAYMKEELIRQYFFSPQKN